MTNNIDWNDWEADNLTPFVFDKLDTVLPELELKFKTGNWYSHLKLDGTLPKERRHDKTVVKKQLPGILIEAGESPRNIIKYYAETRRLEYYQARKELADIVGVELPKANYSEQQTSERKRRDILTDAHEYFVYCLHEYSPGGKMVLDYLVETRGYSFPLIRAMGLGYIPSQKQLTNYLAKKYSADEIKDAIKFNAKIGDTHKLAITRFSAGRVIGFNFRTIGDHSPKYLKPTGQDWPIFINLPARIDNGDLIIVEGEIDSLHATALGIKNVVCVGRQEASDEQLIDAQRRGYTSVTICLDREPQKDNETPAKAIKIGNKAQALGLDVFVIVLPALYPVKTDLDNYLLAKGKDEFLTLINQAQSLAMYKASAILENYANKLPLTDKDATNLRKEIVSVGQGINPNDVADFISRVADPLEGVVKFDKAVLTETIEQLQNEARQDQQRKQLQKLLTETAKADAPLQDITAQLKKGLGEIEANSTDLVERLKPNDWAGFVDKLKATPQGLRTGYIMGHSKTDKDTGEELNELLIPTKATTIIAGRSGHGKTTAMVNLTLKLLQHNEDLKRIYFFTYEMPEEQLIQRALLSFVGHGVGAKFSESPSDALRTLITKESPQYIRAEYRDAVQSHLRQFKTEYIDTGRLTFVDARSKPIEEIRATITALRKRGQIDAVVIDYIQKFTSNQAKAPTGQALMKYVCDELNGLANDTNLPIITGAQFNRSVEYLHNVSELAIREADDIAHLGALILGVYNNDANPTKLGGNSEKASEEEQAKTHKYSHANTFYFEVLKHRFGTAGKGFNLAYCGPLQTLTNYNDGAGVIPWGEQPESDTQPRTLPRATRTK